MSDGKDRVIQIDGEWIAIFNFDHADHWMDDEYLSAIINRLRRLQAKLRKARAQAKTTTEERRP